MSDPWVAALAGVAVAAASALISWAGLRLTARRPGLVVAAVLGGTMVRLLLVAAASIGLLWFADAHPTGYAAGLVLAYLAFLAAEILFVARGAFRPGARRDRHGS